MGRVKHILLVDDEREFLFSATVALRIAGYRVSVAEKARDALERVEEAMSSETPIDLLVTDIRLQGMSGTELIGKVRAEWPSLPVFVVTGYFDRDLERELAAQGCVGHLLKPFNPWVFVDRLERYLGGDRGVAAEA